MTARIDADELAIRGILNDRAKALYAKNADLLFAHQAKDVVSFDLPPPLRFVGDAARDKAGAEAWFHTWKGPIGWETRDLRIAIDGSIAFALSHMTVTKVEGPETKLHGANVDLRLRTTACFKKIGSEWRIVHSHTSVPFYMDGSFKAAVDLRPQK